MQENSDESSNDQTDNPQTSVNPMILDSIKEEKLHQLESKLKDMEMATKSLPEMSSALKNITDSLALIKTTANIPTPNLGTQPHEDVSDTSGEEDNTHQMRRRNKNRNRKLQKRGNK